MIARCDNPPESLFANPAQAILASASHSDPNPMNWMVAQTRSRCEKALAFSLIMAGIPYFLPMQPSLAPSSHALNPLFPGFLFFQDPLNHPRSHASYVKETRFAWNILTTDNQPQLRRELALIAMTPQGDRATNRTTAPTDYRGRLVRIRLADDDAADLPQSPALIGEVFSVSPGSRGKIRLRVNVQILGSSCILETDASRVILLPIPHA